MLLIASLKALSVTAVVTRGEEGSPKLSLAKRKDGCFRCLSFVSLFPITKIIIKFFRSSLVFTQQYLVRELPVFVLTLQFSHPCSLPSLFHPAGQGKVSKELCGCSADNWANPPLS